MSRTRLEKLATDNGFDLPQGDAAGWLGFGSSQVPLRVWFARFGDLYLVALSEARVLAGLAAHLDLAFDRGFVTVAAAGALVVSSALAPEARALLGLDRPQRVRGLVAGHQRYLAWHRMRVFREAMAAAEA